MNATMTTNGKMPKIVTCSFLRTHYACREQRREFAKLFRRGAVVNVKNVRLALDHDLGLTWLMRVVLPRRSYDRLNKDLSALRSQYLTSNMTADEHLDVQAAYYARYLNKWL